MGGGGREAMGREKEAEDWSRLAKSCGEATQVTVPSMVVFRQKTAADGGALRYG